MEKQYAVCVKNKGYEASLELKKIYTLITDKKASAKGLVRIEDESVEDYLYPEEFFMKIDVPHAVEEALSHVKD